MILKEMLRNTNGEEAKPRRRLGVEMVVLHHHYK